MAVVKRVDCITAHSEDRVTNVALQYIVKMV